MVDGLSRVESLQSERDCQSPAQGFVQSVDGPDTAVNVRSIIDELQRSLENTIAEEVLLHEINDRLAALPQSMSSEASRIPPGDIEFLNNVAAMADHLKAFIELKEELADVTLEEYGELMGRLVAIKNHLAPFAVCRRVMEEIRQTSERLPALQAQDEARRKSRLNRRIIDLEHDGPHCRCHHPMVIREAKDGHFWGCSRFPFCRGSAPLTAQQRSRLLQ